MNNKNFSNTIKSKVIIFSLVFFIVIVAGGSAAFFISLRRLVINSSGEELTQLVETKRLQIESELDKPIELLMMLSESPLIRRFFLNVKDEALRSMAVEEILAYKQAFPGHIVTWATDADLKFYIGDQLQPIEYDPNNPYHRWYPAVRDQKEPFSLNVDYDYLSTYTINLYINASVRTAEDGHGIGVVSTSINLSDFLAFLFKDNESSGAKRGKTETYLFNAEGEITGASNPAVVARNLYAVTGAKDGAITFEKTRITGHFGKTGDLIMKEIANVSNGEVNIFVDGDTQYAVSNIASLNWYILIARPVNAALFLNTSMTAVFFSILFAILGIFVGFNVFVILLLNPLIKLDGTIQTILSAIPNPFAVVDDQSRITYISQPLARMTVKQNSEDCVGWNILDVFCNHDLKVLFSDPIQKTGFSESTNEVVVNGKRMFYRTISTDLTGDVQGRFIHLTDITTAMLSSLIDPLTGLANRRSFDRRFEEEWRRAAREQQPISFLMMDVDHFKQYNDAYGHPQGDLLLKTIADIFAGSVKRRTDMPARLGGEEFGLLMANTELDGALQIAELIRSQVENVRIPLMHGPGTTSITISIGAVSVIPNPENDIKQFITQADQHLYEAKHRGRNQVFYG